MNRVVLLDAVVAELFGEVDDAVQRPALEGQDLLLRGDVRLEQDLLLQILHGVVSTDVQGDRLARDELHEDLERVLSTKYGTSHVADVQGVLHDLAVVKELHLTV